MTTRSTSTTPPKHGSPSASMDPPTTPRLRSSTTPALKTPRARQRNTPRETPGRSITSPFLARTPQTPRGIVPSCTFDNSLFGIVTVHTAKCTECDKRNRDTMRRCPGCTFQVCKPCFERREQEGRELMHGNLMNGGATPTTPRTIRKRPLASTPGDAGGIVTKTEAKKDGIIAEMRSEGSEAEKVGAKVKKNEKIPPALRAMAGKKRAARKKPQVQDTSSEGTSLFSSDNDEDEDFESGPISPTPSKRCRTALNFDGIATRGATTSTRPNRKSLPTATTLSRRASDPSSTQKPGNAVDTTGFGLIDFDHEDILHQFGVKGYNEPLLGRRQPVVSNPVIKIPDIVKRNFKPRRTPDEIQRNLQENTMKRIREKSLEHIAAQRKTAEDQAYPHTVRAFAETEAAKYQDDTVMDDDENEALSSAMRDAARKWTYHNHDRKDVDTQNLVKRGLDMRLDKIDGSYKADLINVLNVCATRKLQELIHDSAPSTALTGGRAIDSV
ncbi:Nn.00g085700.m01.CDS01 [Neocucurbitaria sp. VM-36]